MRVHWFVLLAQISFLFHLAFAYQLVPIQVQRFWWPGNCSNSSHIWFISPLQRHKWKWLYCCLLKECVSSINSGNCWAPNSPSRESFSNITSIIVELMFSEHLLCGRQYALCFHTSCLSVIGNDYYFMEPRDMNAQGSIYTCMSTSGRVKLFFSPSRGDIQYIYPWVWLGYQSTRRHWRMVLMGLEDSSYLPVGIEIF